MHPGNPATPWRLDILSGPNAGAAMTLQPGAYSFGQADTNDIVLVDPAVASNHATIHVGTVRATLTMNEGEARIRRRMLRANAHRALRPGGEVLIGDTRLRLSGPAPAPRWRGRIILGAAVLCIAGTGAIATQAADPQPAVPHAVRAAAPAAVHENPLAALRAHLRTNGPDAVRLAAAEGAIIASGTVADADRPRWHEAKVWFDSRFGAASTLIDHTDAVRAPERPILDVRAVGASPMPYVVTASGERYMVGAVIAGGWTITRVTSHEVVLDQGARQVRITL